jgi:uncharacterized protein DUF2846
MEKTVRTLFALLMSSAIMALAGCSLPRTSADTDALAKLMRPVPGKAVIYVFRNQEVSAPWRIELTLDGTSMGSTGANTYYRWSVEPGQHIIASHSQNHEGLVLNTEPDKIYYVWQDVSMGYFGPRARLQEVDRSTAEIALRSCHLLQNRT